MKSKAGRWLKSVVMVLILFNFCQCSDSPPAEKSKANNKISAESPRVDDVKGGNLIRFRDDTTGKFGYKNKSDEVVVLPVFDGAMNFKTNTLARVMQDEKFGYIDTDGNLIIPTQYKLAYPFTKDSEGKITAKVAIDDKHFYIDTTGKCVRDCD